MDSGGWIICGVLATLVLLGGWAALSALRDPRGDDWDAGRGSRRSGGDGGCGGGGDGCGGGHGCGGGDSGCGGGCGGGH